MGDLSGLRKKYIRKKCERNVKGKRKKERILNVKCMIPRSEIQTEGVMSYVNEGFKDLV